MYILGLDLETTGINPETCEVIEVGAVLWDVERKNPVKIYSEIVSGQPVDPEISKLTGIWTEYMVHGVAPMSAALDVSSLMNRCDAVFAHNGNAFDRVVWERFIKEFGVEPVDVVWVDTMLDIEYPEGTTSKRLQHLAADHGLPPGIAHRAVFDVMTMLKIASSYDIPAIVASCKLPLFLVRAEVGFENKDLAKNAGYQWNQVGRRWEKRVRENKLVTEQEKARGYGFRITVLGER